MEGFKWKVLNGGIKGNVAPAQSMPSHTERRFIILSVYTDHIDMIIAVRGVTNLGLSWHVWARKHV